MVTIYEMGEKLPESGHNKIVNFVHGRSKEERSSLKSRADKYDEKLAIKGSFADVFKVVKKISKSNTQKIYQTIIFILVYWNTFPFFKQL